MKKIIFIFIITFLAMPFVCRVTEKMTYRAKCSYPVYNCKDFLTQKEAQAVFDYCLSKTGEDVHGLDADKDGVACEANK